MGKIEDLKNMVATMFERASEREEIERLSQLNNAIDEIEKENTDLLNKNADLIKSYKELVKHTSFKEKPAVSEEQPKGEALSLESFLKDFLAKNKEE